MIELTLKADFSNPDYKPFVAKLSVDDGPAHAVLVADNENEMVFAFDSLVFSIQKPRNGGILDDIIYSDPKTGLVQRWLRATSPHNTLLVTERCDQLCIMCSQPPKKSHTDYFEHFKKACRLAPMDMVVGISGGEPTLFKEQLFDLIEQTFRARPDIRFHVLTNGQHFTSQDIDRLRKPAFNTVLWGVPLYSSQPELHDEIVAKPGAFETLLKTFPTMAMAGINIELRTVMLKQNYEALGQLADFIGDRLPFIRFWAIMQLERIGFAKNRWETQFIDHSSDIEILENSVSRVAQTGMEVALYNVPSCTVSQKLRPYLRQSISDWKKNFPEDCETCRLKSTCSGFFTWHNSLADYRLGGPL